MSAPRLSPTSHVVLGLIEVIEPATPYDLKRLSSQSVANFWALPHTQLYAECARLAELGLLDEEREATGRRRRIYRLTDAGRAALDAWRTEETPATWELRDAGLLKLFLGADPAALAASQLEAHRRKLAEYEALGAVEMPAGMHAALEAGIGFERQYIRFWESVAAEARGSSSAPP